MSIQKKTLAALIALSVGASFGAVANDEYRGYGYGGHDKHEDDGSHNYNGAGNQANDKSHVVDIDKKYIWKTDIDYKSFFLLHKDIKVAEQSNVTIQYGYTGDTKSKSDVNAYAGAYSGNYADAYQKGVNLGAGLGLGLGVGIGLGNGEGGDGIGLGLLGIGIGLSDGDGLGVGLGTGVGLGAGLGLAALVPDQDLDQAATADASVNVWSVSMIKSGDNTLGNSAATHGINTQQAISGQSAMGQQSVNVNVSTF